MASIDNSLKHISGKIDELLITIKGTLELLAISEFDDDVYNPSLMAIERIAGTSSGDQKRA